MRKISVSMDDGGEFMNVIVEDSFSMEIKHNIREWVIFDGIMLTPDQYIIMDDMIVFNFPVNRARHDIIEINTFMFGEPYLRLVSTWRNPKVKGTNHK